MRLKVGLLSFILGGLSSIAFAATGNVSPRASGTLLTTSSATTVYLQKSSASATYQNQSLATKTFVPFTNSLQDLNLGTHTVVSASGSISNLTISTGTFQKILWADGTVQTSSPVASSGGGGVSVYPATSSIFGAVSGPIQYSHSADTDTGMGFAANDTIQFITNGVIASSIGANGAISKPRQPYWQLRLANSMNAATGNGTLVTVRWDTEEFDVGNNYVASGGTVAVTVGGKYSINAAVLFEGMVNHTSAGLRLVTSNRTYIIFEAFAGNIFSYRQLTWPVLVDMDENDTVYVGATVNGPSGKVVNIFGDPSEYTVFSGTLQN